MDLNRKRPKVFYGWYIVGACLLIALYTAGIVNFGFTAVFEPIVQDMGWSYAQVSLAASLRGLEIGILAPVMGILVDRLGPRRLVFTGSILVCAGFIVLSQVSSLAMFYVAFALVAIGMSACTQTVLMTAVANWFRRKARVAIGIAVCGFGLGGLMVPVVTRLVDALQWREAMVIVGLGMLVVVLPLSLLVRHKPEHYGYQPDGEAASTLSSAEHVPAASAEINFTARQAVGNRAFWNVSIAAFCHAFVISAVVTHIMPYLSSLGIDRSFSSMIALVLPVTTIGGRLGGGWLADRVGSKWAFIAAFTSMTAGLLLFSQVTAGMTWLLVPFIITFSLGWGCSVTTRMTLLRELFGRANFGTILGFMSGMQMAGSIAGAPLAGWIFDTWGAYKGAWLGFCAFSVAGVVLALTIPSSGGTVQQPDQLAPQPAAR